MALENSDESYNSRTEFLLSTQSEQAADEVLEARAEAVGAEAPLNGRCETDLDLQPLCARVRPRKRKRCDANMTTKR